MKRAISFLPGLIFLISTSFSHETRIVKGFIINGTVTGFADSTLLFLDDVTDGSFRPMDSALILNGKFQFAGELQEPVVKVYLRNRDFSERKSFWLENSAITFMGEKGKFREAEVNGSDAEEMNKQLSTAIAVSKDKKATYKSFIRNNRASIVSASILDVYASTWGRDTTAVLFKGFTEEARNTFYGKNLQQFITLNRNVKVGDAAVDFIQKDIHDIDISLSSFSGKIVLLEFWGSWCFPCREGHPALIKTYHEFHDRGFEILGVAADTKKEQWLEAVAKDSLPWTNVSDLKGDHNKAALIYGVSYYPMNYLIGRDGTIIATDLRGDKLRERLLDLLK